jgi:hypothetical protein
MTFVRDNYPPEWDKEIVPRIRQRDGYKCTVCGIADRTWYYNTLDGNRVQLRSDATGRLLDGQHVPPGFKLKRIYLNTAHLDQKLVNHSDDNLASMCPGCHLNYDRVVSDAQRQRSRRYGALATRRNPQQQVLSFYPDLASGAE